MQERTSQDTAAHSEKPHIAGTPISGDFVCRVCSYGVSIFRALPTCPMCGGSEWVVRTARGMFTRRARIAAR
jgi:Zn finger protein HypA/HybF involved in hydrogenase expression